MHRPLLPGHAQAVVEGEVRRALGGRLQRRPREQAGRAEAAVRPRRVVPKGDLPRGLVSELAQQGGVEAAEGAGSGAGAGGQVGSPLAEGGFGRK